MTERKSLRSGEIDHSTIEKNFAEKEYYTEARLQIIRANDIASRAVTISWIAAATAIASLIISIILIYF